MGVCPQFDTGLWELLTGHEHLTLFASIKGLPALTRAVEVSKLLEDVKVRSVVEFFLLFML
jgi:ABC-type multidrug transport system ATPase subunit